MCLDLKNATMWVGLKKIKAQKLHTFKFNQEKQPWDFFWKRFSCDHAKHVDCPLSIETFKDISFTWFPNFIIHHWLLSHNKIFYSLEVARWSHALDGAQLVRLSFLGVTSNFMRRAISQVSEMKIHLTRGSRRPNLFILLFPLLFQDSIIAENIRVFSIITFI